jgi:hypothetical protein
MDAGKRLGHVAAVCDSKLEQTPATAWGDPEPPQLQAAHHGAGRAYQHDDAEPDPHRDARADGRARGQQHQRIVISGLGLPRHPRRDEE